MVTDREKSLQYGIHTVLRQNINFLCWNHIQQDVKHWVKSENNTTKEDIKVYDIYGIYWIHHLQKCLRKYGDMNKFWSENFKDYFNNNNNPK